MARVIALVLALTLSLTAQAYALARGQAAGGVEMVICAGGATVVVALDAQGRPTGPRHLCPDAVMVFGALPASPPAVALAGALVRQAELACRERAAPSCRAGHAQARAPPAVI
jgi:hypothetical protein